MVLHELISKIVRNRLINSKVQCNITICGGGNAAHLLAAYVGALKNTKTAILNTVPYEYEYLTNVMKKTDHRIVAEHRDGFPSVAGMVDTVSNKPHDVIPFSDVIVIAVPAHVHEHYFKLIAPHVSPNTVLGVMVAEGGLDWMARDVFGSLLDTHITLFGMETLPWACRIKEYGHTVKVLATKREVDVAAYPSDRTAPVCDLLGQLLHPWNEGGCRMQPVFHSVSNMLSLTLMNINSVWHPCILYGRFHGWDGQCVFPEHLLFYEGVDDFTASVLDAVSNEVLRICDKIRKEYPGVSVEGVMHVEQWIRRAYSGQISDVSSLRSCINTNSGYKGILHPMRSMEGLHGFIPDTEYRYWVEDLPCGLIATRGLAGMLGVDTPMMDSVIRWMQTLAGKEYLLPTGELSGKDIGETRAPERFGLDINSVMDFYQK